MGQEHFNKTITHSWQVGAKIMNQSKQVSLSTKKKYSCKLPRRKEGRDFFRLYTRKIDTGLPALARCSSVFQQVQMLR